MNHNKQDRTFAEFLVPQFISEYCDSCHTPIEEEEAVLTEHLPSTYIRTKVDRHYCIECVSEMIYFRDKVRRDQIKGGRRKLRNVSEMTLELVEKSNWDNYYKAYDQINFGKA